MVKVKKAGSATVRCRLPGKVLSGSASGGDAKNLY